MRGAGEVEGARAREMSARSVARIQHRGQVFRGYGAAARFGN